MIMASLKHQFPDFRISKVDLFWALRDRGLVTSKPGKAPEAPFPS
ncbi:uncharacterized protein G2W53_003896 [Senna tora]|uniref:Uncharacterized protein n=1 Tax=Senna tora TaxID=362788 RepID=A0A834X9H5_9FABA|nr:uncharacterized protein G2W53_003896 [Senna tora]